MKCQNEKNILEKGNQIGLSKTNGYKEHPGKCGIDYTYDILPCCFLLILRDDPSMPPLIFAFYNVVFGCCLIHPLHVCMLCDTVLVANLGSEARN